MKKCLSIILTAAMFLCYIPGVFAEGETAIEPETESTITAGNGMGAIVANLTAADTAEQTGGYVISDMIFRGILAKVTLNVAADCTLVVAVYDENTSQMLGSGFTKVTAPNYTENLEDYIVDVPVNIDEMPQHFLAKAFLLDDGNCALCKEYVCKTYTTDYEIFLNTTPEDFPDAEVLTLDDAGEDFGVLAEGVTVSEASTEMTYEHKDGTYTFRNATDVVKKSAKGDVLYVPLSEEPGDFLLVKVASVTVSGSTVTIKEDDDIQLEDAFRFIRIDEDADFSDVEIDEAELGSALTLQKKDARKINARNVGIDEEKSKTFSKVFNLKYPKSAEDDKSAWENGWNVTGELIYTLTASVKLYYDIRWGADEYEFKTELKQTISFMCAIDGKVSLKKESVMIPIGTKEGIPIGLFKLYIKVYPIASVSASMDLLRCKLEITNAAAITRGGLSKTNDVKKWVDKPNMGKTEIVIRLGLGVEAEFGRKEGDVDEEGFSTLHASVSLSAEAGVVITLQTALVGTLFDELHDCDFCLSGQIDWFVEGYLSARLKLFVNKLRYAWDSEPIQFKGPLGAFYVSFGKEGLTCGMGECPHIYHKTTLLVCDGSGNAVEGAEITAEQGRCDAEPDGKIAEHTMLTDAQGKAVFYFPLGAYQVDAKKSGVGIASQKIRISGTEETVKVTLISQAHDGTFGALTWKLDEDGLLTISGNGGMDNFGYGSKGAWLAYKDAIKAVTIEEGVTSIGNYAFYECSQIQKIDIPNSVTSLGELAMYRNSGLKYITIPDQVTSIGKSCFGYCSSLISAVFGKNVTSMGAEVFRQCNSLKQITLGEQLSAIPDYFCWNCTSLKTVVIPDKVTTIGNSAFEGCSSLRDVVFGSLVTSVGYNAFKQCNSLINLSLGNVETIAHDAFAYNVALKTLTLPNSCHTIGPYAFAFCSSLRQVSFGSRITSIGRCAFLSCSSLGPVSLPEGLLSIGASAFNSDNNMGSITVPASVTSIGGYAFYGEGIFVYYPGTKEQWNKIASDSHNVYDSKHLICSDSSPVVSANKSLTPVNLIRKVSGEKTAFLAHTAPGYEYVLLVVKDLNAEALLAADNLLYIDQKTAEDETISFGYLPRDSAAKASAKIYGVDARELPPPHTHSYTEAVTTEATCGQPGVKTFTCECGNSYTEEIPATGEHTFGEWTVTKPATVDTQGEELRTCSVCGEEETRAIPKAGPAAPEFTPGDVNDDGKVGSDDARLALRASVKLEPEITEGTPAFRSADYNGDGTVKSEDARAILRVSVKLDPFG